MDSAQLYDEETPSTYVEEDVHAIHHFLKPVRHLLTSDMTDLCINRPGEAWVEARGGWTRHFIPDLTYAHLSQLARTAANAARQSLNEQKPILSAALPTGERIQVVLPPAAQADTISFTIRKPSQRRFSLDDYQRDGFFDHVVVGREGLLDDELELQRLLKARDLGAFFALAVRSRKTIIVSGGTGSGKTTFMKALVDEIPDDERLITIEDTPELEVRQANHVRLFYSKGGQAAANVSAMDLLEACMRMKPDRILQAEVRDSAALHFVNGANSGHPGSITSIHANSAPEAFGRLAFLMGGDEAAAGMTRQDIMNLITATVDIVVQVGKASGIRAVTGIHYAPERKLALMG